MTCEITLLPHAEPTSSGIEVPTPGHRLPALSLVGGGTRKEGTTAGERAWIVDEARTRNGDLVSVTGIQCSQGSQSQRGIRRRRST
jgi:hypothetical protein